MSFDILTASFLELIAAHIGNPLWTPSTIRGIIAPPAKNVNADFSLPCFQLSKAMGKPPPAVATDLANAVNADSNFGVRASSAGPFLNLTLSTAVVASTLLTVLAADPTAALRSDIGAGKTVCIDFSSPNIAKHLAFHHIRSTMIGNSLAFLYGACGWRAVRINFLGDWGTAFGRLITGWKLEGLTLEQLNGAPDKVTFLNELYVRISTAAKGNPEVEEQARRWSKALEDGDEEARTLWQLFKDASLGEFQRVYAMLGVTFDSWKGEAYYEDKMAPVLEELGKKDLLVVENGATVVHIPGTDKPVLFKRADGGTLYATRDLAACKDRFQEFNFDRALYVVDMGQGLHFREWFAVTKLMGYEFADRLRHTAFGIVLMWNDDPAAGAEPGWARTRTRGGKVMLLREVLEEAIDRARAVIAEKNPDIVDEEREQIARMVGIGAVVFNDLKGGRQNDVRFKFEEALRFDGATGPYLQYSHARLCSIERKFAAANPAPALPDYGLIQTDDEKAVLLSIAKLKGALERAVETDEPSVLASALLSLSGSISSWLTSGGPNPLLRVLCEDVPTMTARVALVAAARACVGEGLRLLGLGAPVRM